MSKTVKRISLLLALLLLLQLAALCPPSAYADGETAIGWVVRVKSGEETLSLADEEAMTAALGAPLVLDFGKSESGGAISAPTVADLRRNGLRITPPAGYSVSSLLIAATGTAPAADSRSLLSLAKADSAGNSLSLPAAIFAEDFNAGAVGTVFNGSGEGGYTIIIDLVRIAPVLNLRYTPGSLVGLSDKLGGSAALAEGGDSLALPVPEGGSGVSCTLASLSAAAQQLAFQEYGARFTGWKLVYASGVTALAQAGDTLTLTESVTAEAQWEESILFRFDSGEKLYDGTALSVGYTQVGTLKDGDTLVLDEGAVHASLTEAGEAEATLDIGAIRVLRGESDVTGEYRFAVQNGTLRVVRRGITFRVSDVSAPYSGAPVTPNAYTVESGSLVEGHSAEAVYAGQQTLPGSSTGSASFTIRDAEGRDVSANYAISVINGSITVNELGEKRAITVTLQDTEKEYDGTNTATAGYSISAGSLLSGDELVPTGFTGSITGVGSGSISASFAVKNGESDVSGNYEITVIPAKLTVKAREITLSADSAEKVFDGSALQQENCAVTAGSLLSGHRLEAVVKGSQTAIGSSENVIDTKSVKITDAEGRDVTAQYHVTLKNGTLTVKAPADATALTITMKSAEKVYDGTALTAKEYMISSGALAAGDELVGTVSGSQTNVGESPVTAVFSVRNGQTDVTGKYTLTVIPGKLTVKPREIIVTAGSASKIYDGRPLTRDSYSVTKGELVKGHKLTASVTGSQTELGSSANSIVKNSVKITDAAGNDVSANYSITTAAGTLSVNRDPITSITLSPGEHTKVYDGSPYTLRGADLKVTSGTLPAGYQIEASFNPEAPTDAGKYEVTIKSVTIRNASGADVTNQFNITRAKGSLTIDPRPLVIETGAANKVYDGSALTERSTPTITGRVDGQQVTLRITGSQTKVGSSENTVSDVKITDKDTGADVTKNYDIRYQLGRLTVSDEADSSAGYSWVSGSVGTLFIKLDHAYDGFEGLQVDGKDLDRNAYTSASGSTDIWLKSGYLNTLSTGSHTLSARYSGGERVNASFVVDEAQDAHSRSGSSFTLWVIVMIAALLAIVAAALALVWTRRNSAHRRRSKN